MVAIAKQHKLQSPYRERYIKINGANLHYIDEGNGTNCLFIHGIPTSSYVWRHVIKDLQHDLRCIAPDLIGMGKSDKPDIPYRVFDHIEYLEKFINKLNLDKLILVLHGWGSIIGLDYARRHPEKISGIVLIEAHIRHTHDKDNLSLPLQELATIREQSDGGYHAIMHENFYVNVVLQNTILKKLLPEELAYYQEPFIQPDSAKPLWQYLQDLPLGDGSPKDVVELVNECSVWLQQAAQPKLLLYSMPGYLTTMDTLIWAKQHIYNLTIKEVGEALHYPQETTPNLIVKAISEWLTVLPEKEN